MSEISIETTVGELVSQRPERSRIFESLDIDYCCGGKKSLALACREKGLDPLTVRRLLDTDLGTAPARSEANWSTATLSALADHIQNTHHAYLKSELPRLLEMVRKVAAVHGNNHPWLLELDGIFRGFAAEMESHTLTEEEVLFPIIRNLDQGRLAAVDDCGGTVLGPIGVMEREHDDAGRALARIRELSDGYVPPADACNTFRATLTGLLDLERDMHRHVHLENSILFPRASEIETHLRQRA
jgi:regulator of cell morphogenesis and NO signaling